MNADDGMTAALAVLRDAMMWQLPSARWAEIDRSVVALGQAVVDGDVGALWNEISALETYGPVRRATEHAPSVVSAPETVRAHVTSVISALERLRFPVTIYLSDAAIHREVEQAVIDLVRMAGITIIDRDDPVSGSWFRRLHGAMLSPAGQAALHRADVELVLRQDAEVTAIFLQNLGPLLTSLQPTRDAVVRAGALLVVKVDWVVAVHQLTPRQQLILDNSPGLEASPHEILRMLGAHSPGELAEAEESD